MGWVILTATAFGAWVYSARNIMPRCVAPCRLCGTPSSKHLCKRCGAHTP